MCFPVSFALTHCTKKFSIKDFFSKCDQIRSFLRIWSHLRKKSLIENFIFCAVTVYNNRVVNERIGLGKDHETDSILLDLTV